MSVRLVLPYPVSANRYWTQFQLGARMMQAPSKEAKAYKKLVGQLALVAGVRKPIEGRVALTIRLFPQRPKDADKRAKKNPLTWDDDVRSLDLDNALKVLIDAIKDVVIADDKFVFQILAQRCEPDGEARVELLVESMLLESPQLALE